ncbi:MAG: selenocysteine-specific translation elongation factor [Lachnoclostridium sp.]|nr:selenocysteine-specific translation elongation factor [Lachnoclostridium sp.]
MQNVIVGTSGHVDHGKTCLIKALSGIDTDRLKEEKKRGITIELGFANLPNDEGLHIGIIDVPGHEKFVKNMLAGIGGIDLVLLVVGLDEGVMPQTVEHFEILKMLHVKQGIIVFTKSDLVDDDWAEMVEEDVSSLVEGSFLEHADRIRVSAYTGENIDLLKKMILDKVRGVGMRRSEPELFRLPIDRVFTMEGFGTVITGTLLEGSCRVGEDVMVYPEERLIKIRGIQSHGQKEEAAYAGQRTAINLANVKKEELERGQVLAAPGTLTNSIFLDAKVSLFNTTNRQLKNGDRVHVNYGSAQTIAKAVLLDKDVIGAGESAYVQLRFDEPLAVKRGDRFIIRFYSPVETFGGGIILDACPGKHKRHQEELLQALTIRENGTDDEILELVLKEESIHFPSVHDLASKLNWNDSETEKRMEKLKKQKKALSLNDGNFFHKEFWDKVVEKTGELLTAFHKTNPIASGMDKEEFKSRILDSFYLKDYKKGDVILNELIKRGTITTSESTVAVAGFSAQYSDAHSDMRNVLLQTYMAAGFEAPSTDDVMAKFKDKKQAKQVLNDLFKEGTLVKLNPGAYLYKDHYAKAMELLRSHYATHDTMSLAEFRDMMGTSRKYVLLFLDHLDQQKITKLQGDVRILLK